MSEKNNNERRCATCKTTAKELRAIHPFVQKAYDQATFECPQRCGLSDILLKDLMQHCNEECDFRLVKCPFVGCNEVLNRFTISKHRSQCKFGMPKRCPKCEGELKPDHDCTTHLLSKIKNESVPRQTWFSQMATI